MNISFQLILVLALSLEAAFTDRLVANCVVIVVAIAYLLYKHVRIKTLGWLFAVPSLMAIALFVTLATGSQDNSIHFAWVMVSRVYMYVFAGATVAQTGSSLTLARSLEQNLHLPSKYAYGTLAAINMIPRIRRAVSTIRAAGLMRGEVLSWWSPTLYFKAILQAINWSEQLAMAMETHAYVEGAPRTKAVTIPVRARDWLLLIGLFVAYQALLLIPF